jgi:hypothetical protein
LYANRITVNAKIDSTIIRIGSQARLYFNVTQLKNQHVVLPVFSDSIKGGLEIVEMPKSDTTSTPDGLIQVSQSYVVTAFEDSLLYIPSFPFVENGDTVWSNALSLKVIQPFKIDTSSNVIADIKPLFDPKFDWDLFYRICFVLFVLQLIIFVGYMLYRKYWRHSLVVNDDSQPKQAPHIIALNQLDLIKQDKLWQKGRSKEFHTELTDVIRQYIEGVFKINSLEMTSDEILEHLKALKFEKKAVYSSLLQILQLADLVKFAKWDALPEEHELSLINAYLFVNQTKIEDVRPLDEQLMEQSEDKA